MRPPWYENGSALVVGLARSGVAACRLLRRHGCRVRGSDLRNDADFAGRLEDLKEIGVEIVLGDQDGSLLKDVDFVVVSPGVPPAAPLVKAAERAGLRVVAELEIAFHAATAPIVAVTGTNGKSTCVEMLGEVFRTAGREVAVAGNVGTALSEVVETVPTSGVLVVEVSSFQLERIVDFRPNVAVLLNVTPDHLDRHGGLQRYMRTKLRIFMNQDDHDVSIVNADQPEVVAAAERVVASRLARFSLEHPVAPGAYLEGEEIRYDWGGEVGTIVAVRELRVPGPHNAANAMASSVAALAMGVTPGEIGRGLLAFKGLEHRMEQVAEIRGVRFVNDSKATNPDSLRQALLSVPSPALLVAGGRDKGARFEELAPLVRERVKCVFLIGEAAQRMARAWHGVETTFASSLEEGVRAAWAKAQSGDWVVLSPGCASFDMFEDFEDRGRRFKEIVRTIAREEESQ